MVERSSLNEITLASLDWYARGRQVDLLKSMLTSQFSHLPVSDRKDQCCLLLRNAVVSGCADVVTSLLSHVDRGFLLQCDGHDDGDDGRTHGRTRVDKLLGLAVEHGHKEIAEVLLARGARPNSLYRGKPLLHLSCRLGHHAVAMALLDKGADVSSVDSAGESALFAALAVSSDNSIAVVDRLLSEGADPGQRSTTGRQPLHCAALSSNIAALRQLLKSGCDVSARDAIMGDAPLHLACSRCSADAVFLLLQHGADLNGANNAGDTPLRKLLQHITRCRMSDSQAKSRLQLALTLMQLGFRLAPCSAAICCQRTSALSVGQPRDSAARPGHHSLPPGMERTLFAQDALWNVRRTGPGSHRGPPSDNKKRRDKVRELYDDLKRKSGAGHRVPSLQHISRMEVRRHLPSRHFQTAVRGLELSFQMRQYLMFEGCEWFGTVIPNATVPDV